MPAICVGICLFIFVLGCHGLLECPRELFKRPNNVCSGLHKSLLLPDSGNSTLSSNHVLFWSHNWFLEAKETHEKHKLNYQGIPFYPKVQSL